MPLIHIDFRPSHTTFTPNYTNYTIIHINVTVILIASRPPAATQGFRDRGLPTFKIEASKPRKQRTKTNTHAKKHSKRQRERVKKEGRTFQKMSEKYCPGGGRRVQNEGPEGSWALLGAMWAQGGRRERPKSLLAAARGRPGAPKNSMDASLGPLGAKS